MEVANKSDAAWNSIGLFFMNDQYEENCSIDSIFYYLFGMIQHKIKLCSIYSFFSMGPRASLLDCLMKF